MSRWRSAACSRRRAWRRWRRGCRRRSGIARAAGGGAAAAGRDSVVLCAAAAVVPGALEGPSGDLYDPAGGAAQRRARPRGAGGGARRSGRAAREPAHVVPGRGSVCRGRRSCGRRRRGRGWRSARSPRSRSCGGADGGGGAGLRSVARDSAAGASVRARRRRACAAAACCITSPATAGRSVRCRATWRRCTGRGARAWQRAVRRCRCSMPTTRCGSRRCWATRTTATARWRGSWRSGPQALAELPEQIELPADRPRPAVASHRGGHVALDDRAGAASRASRRWRVSTGASLFMVLQAGLAGCCSAGSARAPTSPIGSPIAGRTDGALDDLVGFFVNTLVLRTDTVGQPELPGADRPGAGQQPGGLRPPGSAVRAAGRGAQSGAVAVAASAVPGDAGVRGGGSQQRHAGAAGTSRSRRSRSRPRAPSSTCRLD